MTTTKTSDDISDEVDWNHEHELDALLDIHTRPDNDDDEEEEASESAPKQQRNAGED